MTLSFYTWSEFEKNCGYSRLYGGVNFPDAVSNIRYSTVILKKKVICKYLLVKPDLNPKYLSKPEKLQPEKFENSKTRTR